MRASFNCWLALVLVALLSPLGFSVPSISTVPAFLWSSHYPNHGVQESVNYQTLSAKDLANSVLSEAGWSNLMCSANKVAAPVDVALVFVGRKWQSSDLYGSENGNNDLTNMVKVSLSRSNYSMSFPYIAAPEEETLANSLLSGFAEICGRDAGFGNVAFTESCSQANGNSPRLSNLESVNEYLESRKENRANGEPDVVVFCHEDSNAEGETFDKLVNSVDQSGEKYAVLYVSEPSQKIQYPSHREVQRFLAETTNVSSCGEVCQIKSTLLESLFVDNCGKSTQSFRNSEAIVLLIILISGICCMMGIDTPTRFEAAQDS